MRMKTETSQSVGKQSVLDSGPDSMASVFAYGTLRCSKVREALLSSGWSTQEDVFVHNFLSHPVLNCLYPAATHAPNTTEIPVKIRGTLITGLNEENMAILDYFEGDEYSKETVPVYSSDGELLTDAFMYIWSKPMNLTDTTRNWTFETDFEGLDALRDKYALDAVTFRRNYLSTV